MKRGDAVLSNWHVLIDNYSASGQAFFELVERAVREREVPQVTFSRNDFRESGILSDKRTYLRLRRGNLIFDIGAAPYGIGYFFSWWLVREGPRRAWVYLLGFALIMFFVPSIFSAAFLVLAPVVYPFALIGTFVLLGLMARAGTFGPDENIIALPVLGWLYETLFSPVTYYALDTANMFRESVSWAVNEAIDAVLADQGLQALSEEQKRPVSQALAA